MKKKLIMALTGVYLLLALSIPVHAAVTDTGFSDVVVRCGYDGKISLIFTCQKNLIPAAAHSTHTCEIRHVLSACKVAACA